MYFVEFMLAWDLNSISFPKHNSYKLEDSWQAQSRERKVYVNPMVWWEQVSSDRKNSRRDFPDSSVKGFLAISHDTVSSWQKYFKMFWMDFPNSHSSFLERNSTRWGQRWQKTGLRPQLIFFNCDCPWAHTIPNSYLPRTTTEAVMLWGQCLGWDRRKRGRCDRLGPGPDELNDAA